MYYPEGYSGAFEDKYNLDTNKIPCVNIHYEIRDLS